MLGASQTLSHFTGPYEVGIVTPTLQKQKQRHTEHRNDSTHKHMPLTHCQQCQQMNRFLRLQNLKHITKSLPGGENAGHSSQTLTQFENSEAQEPSAVRGPPSLCSLPGHSWLQGPNPPYPLVTCFRIRTCSCPPLPLAPSFSSFCFK